MEVEAPPEVPPTGADSTSPGGDECPQYFEVCGWDGERGRLASVRLTREKTFCWQLSLAGRRQGGPSRSSRHGALLAWLDNHGALLDSGALASLRQAAAACGTGCSPAEPDRGLEASQPSVEAPPQIAPSGSGAPAAPAAGPVPLLECPLCSSYRSQSTARGLVRHLTSRHLGQALGEEGARTLRAVDRGICQQCGGMRSVWSRQCCHCLASQPVRPALPSDKVVLPQVDRRCKEHRPGRSTQGRTDLPTDWDRRIDLLPSVSVVHIPSSLRERFALAMAQGLEDLLAGGSLERGRTKLLLALPPKGLHLRSELETRLWM